ncbi:MAG: T9SS type A sorting domain-containing protein [Melioribacteraceae bacterium]|nr:T9SS type A sorting domain-containing protein [Melioribacteraceae bacterium]
MWRIITLIIIVLIFNTLTAQERMILRSNGEQIKLNHKKDMREAIRETKLIRSDGKEIKSHFVEPINVADGSDYDTLTYRRLGGAFNVDFGFNGQDVMIMLFEAEYDMTIEGIGFTCSDDEGTANATVELRLIRLNWTKEQLMNFNEATQIGYYPSSGDGFNESDPFGEEATGNWISKDSSNFLPPWTDNADPAANTFNYDLLLNNYILPITPVASELGMPIYNWLDLVTTGIGTVEVKKGEVFAVVATHDGTTLDGDRIGFWSDNTIGYPGWKYYENGRFSSDEPGWWVRMYTWDFAVAVEIVSCPYIFISDVTILQTTVSTEARRVEVTILDDSPSGESNTAWVNLLYSIDGSNMDTIAMTANGEVYSAYIPGQTPGTVVTYSVEATDIQGYYSRWARDVTYHIFKVENNNALLLFNGPEGVSQYPQSYYFGSGNYPYGNPMYAALDWNHDVWAFGALTEELVNNYDNIIEITTFGPASINNDVIRAWLAGDGNRNYLLAGDEWLGAQYGWPGTLDIPDGDFAKDIMGINVYHSDINYAGSGDQQLPSDVNAVEGSLLGGELFTLHKQVSADSGWTSSIQYNPTHEVGADNWLDGVEFTDGVEVDMTGIGIDGNIYNIGGHRTLTTGNKVAFLAFDPLSLSSNLDGEYWWYGFTYEAPQVQALLWFDAVVSVNEKSELPETFSLSQNYPNPFNPSTTIKYSIPVVETRRGVSPQTPLLGGVGGGLVTLKVYDILGREVATLVNKEQMPGNYEVQFTTNGGLTSGVYFYQLKSGSFSATKKLLLLK